MMDIDVAAGPRTSRWAVSAVSSAAVDRDRARDADTAIPALDAQIVAGINAARTQLGLSRLQPISAYACASRRLLHNPHVSEWVLPISPATREQPPGTTTQVGDRP